MDGVLIDLGFIQIYWYSIFIFVALLVGGSLALKQASKKGISEDEMINYFFFLIPICILGARLYYVIFNFNLYKDNLLDILKIWEGGLAIHGGLLAGIIFTLIYCKKNSYSFLELADIL
ncbi:MAG: prolipoprotein diacylglyceryl transferase, partial [Bacilli bacterium]|nr:prolipoprotein diacylglyceryl transferase [Bacilli bacterium]